VAAHGRQNDESTGRRGRARDGMSDRTRGVFMISIAADLAGMHPQTLRMYEERGLVSPKRSPKNTRLYSQEDVEHLQRIQRLTTELGLNLAGVERVLELERELERAEKRVRRLERALERAREEAERAVDRARREGRRELVRYEGQYAALVPVRGGRAGRSSPSRGRAGGAAADGDQGRAQAG
jgi:MerR family transcriptional regulator/heat shock protein HspR